MKFELLFHFILSYNCVYSINVEGFEFQDNKAMTHITEENGIASIEFLVDMMKLEVFILMFNAFQGY